MIDPNEILKFLKNVSDRLSFLRDILDSDAAKEIKDAAKKLIEYSKEAANFVEIDAESLSMQDVVKEIKQNYFFDNTFSGVAVLKEKDNKIVCVYLSNNDVKIGAKHPLVSISYKGLGKDLQEHFSDKQMLVIK